MTDDTGTADPALALALTRGTGLLAAFVGARVFAAISATSTAEHVTEHGLRAESSADMAVLLLEVDGARALPVFSDLAQLKHWDLASRPVPLTGAEACQAALDEGAEAVVLDPAGTAVVVAPADVRTLAAGWVPVTGSPLASRVARTAFTTPDDAPEALVARLRSALAPEQIRAARLVQGPDGLVLGLVPRRPLSPPDLAALASRVMERLGDQLPSEGLDVTVVPARGPGLPVVRRWGVRRRR